MAKLHLSVGVCHPLFVAKYPLTEGVAEVLDKDIEGRVSGIRTPHYIS